MEVLCTLKDEGSIIIPWELWNGVRTGREEGEEWYIRGTTKVVSWGTVGVYTLSVYTFVVTFVIAENHEQTRVEFSVTCFARGTETGRRTGDYLPRLVVKYSEESPIRVPKFINMKPECVDI